MSQAAVANAAAIEAFKALLGALPDDPVASSVELLLGQLPGRSSALLRLCAIPHRWDAATLRVLAPDLGADEAERRYDDFLELAVVSSGGQAARLHDAARGYLFRRWLTTPDRPVFAAASRRLAEHFTALRRESTGSAEEEQLLYSAMFHRIGADEHAGIREFSALFKERRRQFRIGECDRLVKLVCEYEQSLSAESAAVLSYRKGQNAADYRQWPKATLAFQAVLDNAAADADLRVRAHNRLGMIAAASRQYRSAITCFEQALELSASSGRSGRYAHRILREMGAAYRDLGDLDRALELLTESVTLATAANDLSSVAACQNSLGMLHQRRHEMTEAVEAYRASVVALEQLALPVQQAKVYDNLGTLHTEAGNWSGSMEAYGRSLEITRAAGDAFGQAITLNNLARVHQRSKDEGRAVELFKEAGALFEQVGDMYNAGQVQCNLGRTHLRLRNVNGARDAFTQAIGFFNRAGAAREEEATRRELARMEHRAGLPWWAWLSIIFVVAFLALFVWATVADV